MNQIVLWPLAQNVRNGGFNPTDSTVFLTDNECVTRQSSFAQPHGHAEGLVCNDNNIKQKFYPSYQERESHTWDIPDSAFVNHLQAIVNLLIDFYYGWTTKTIATDNVVIRVASL